MDTLVKDTLVGTTTETLRFNLGNYDGTEVQIAFFFDDLSGEAGFLWLDNFVIDAMPNCQDLQNLSVTQNNSSTLDVSFTGS